jgi:hypothetical protein
MVHASALRAVGATDVAAARVVLLVLLGSLGSIARFRLRRFVRLLAAPPFGLLPLLRIGLAWFVGRLRWLATG